MKDISDLKVKIFADGAVKASILEQCRNPLIKGFTTNPTLMRKAGIEDYTTFARDVLSSVSDRPISFEVFSDEFDEMERHAKEIASWGRNVFVKIPVTNTRGVPCYELIQKLAAQRVQLNVTALLTINQIHEVAPCLAGATHCFISVFAGRYADTGRDPVPLMRSAVEYLKQYPNIELIWASPRELLNVFQADDVGCHVITVTQDILQKLSLVGKDLDAYSLDTVRMFYEDAQRAGYRLKLGKVAVAHQ